MLGSFYAWVVNQKVNALEDRRKLRKFIVSGPPFVATIPWIEILLQTPMDGHRKFVMWQIITSYSINMRKLSYKESSHTIRQWLRKSNALSKLDFDGDQRVKVSQNRTAS
jgi:hypothetical protein